jgi:predicted AlkP superfamily pyrophosphatase or phosphodiesterase
MRAAWGTFLAIGLALIPHAVTAAPVMMISVDGLRPSDVLDASARGNTVPTLSKLAQSGAYSTGVHNALPTVTYPNHTTLITGVWPAKHGIPNNVAFDPLQKNMAGWYWYAEDIKVPTLWDSVHQAHGVVASLSWPVSVGDRSIDYNLPEYWRANIAEDIKLVHALATPGEPEMLEKATGIAYLDADGETVDRDLNRMKFAAALIRLKHPMFTTIHLRGLDHTQHEFGPGTPQAKAVMTEEDAGIGALITAARAAEPDLVVAVVSDHGFAKVDHDINIIGAFVREGLITIDPKTHKPNAWQAEPWGGASAAVVLANPNDAALKAKVAALLNRLASDPQTGIVRIVDAGQIAQMGGTPMASFWIDFKSGYQMGTDPSAPLVSPGSELGTHGYFPEHPEMHATFIIDGAAVAKKGSLGEIDMRDIAPTLAKIMNVHLPSADGHPLF